MYSSAHLVSGARFFNPQVPIYEIRLRCDSCERHSWFPGDPDIGRGAQDLAKQYFAEVCMMDFFFYTYGFVWTMDCMAQLRLK